MARTYAPQFAKMLQKVSVYWGKHQTQIKAVASAQQQADAASIVSTINNAGGWGAVNEKETP